MYASVKRVPPDEASGPAKKLIISTRDRSEGYMAKPLEPVPSETEKTEIHVKLSTPDGGHISVRKKISETPEIPEGTVVDLNQREDQVARALGPDFSFEKHSISSDVRKNWLWHWLGLEYHAPGSFLVQRNVRIFKFFMGKPWFQMCMEAEDAQAKVAADPSKFYVRLSRSKPGAISITFKLTGKLEPNHVRTYPCAEGLETYLGGLHYVFTKENLVTVVRSWIATGHANDYVSSSPAEPFSSPEPGSPEPALYLKVSPIKSAESTEYL
jgi:hypothetical protein